MITTLHFYSDLGQIITTYLSLRKELVHMGVAFKKQDKQNYRMFDCSGSTHFLCVL